MTAFSRSSDTEALIRRSTRFEGFPYLFTPMMAPLCHMLLLPADRSEKALQEMAELQVLANKLETFLVFSHERAIRYDIDGTPSPVAEAPCGGALVTGKLRAAEEFPPMPELLAREESLREFIKSQHQTGYLVGSPQLGYRPATADQISRLSGHGADGVPVGLVRCGDCGAYRGECLESGSHSQRKIARVYCQCENHNRCARCGNPLAAWRLYAHHYDERENKILFQPTFSAMSHECTENLRRVH